MSTDAQALSGDEIIDSLITNEQQDEPNERGEDSALTEENAQVEGDDVEAGAESEGSEGEGEEQGEDVYQFEVDGETREVPASELLAAYEAKQNLENSTADLEAKRQAEDARLQQIDNERKAEVERVSQIITQLEALNPEPDWVALAQEDPIGFAQAKAEWDAKQVQINKAKEQLQSQVAEQRNQTLQREQAKLLTVVPEWRDQKVRAAEEPKLVQFARDQGYSDAELAQLTHARDIATLRKAMKWDELQAKKPAALKKVKKASKVIKAGASKSKSQATAEEKAALKERLRKTGSEEDAIAYLLSG